MENLGAETTADIRGHHPQLVLRDAQNKCAHQQADHVGVLRCGVKRVITVRAVVIAHGHARLHRVGDQPVVDQFQGCDMRRFLKRLIHRALVFLDKSPIIAQV